MKATRFPRTVTLATLTLLTACAVVAQEGGEKSPARSAQAWTLDEALQQLALYPRDPYLQYVALQLASREGRIAKVAESIQRSTGEEWREARMERRNRVDLFNVFSGALAVHESLQMDTMLGDRRAKASPFEKDEGALKEFDKEPPKEATGVPGEAPKAEPKAEEKKRSDPTDRKVRTGVKQLFAGKSVPGVRIDSLTGPTIKSHPWDTMLGGRKPEVSTLSKMVPADQYFVQCRSLTSLLELLDFGDLWASHLFNQASQDATSSNVGTRLRQQLAVRADPLTRPFYDLVVDQVAITGSDLFVREGSDVTLHLPRQASR